MRLTRRSPGSGFIAAGHLPAADLGAQLTAAREPPKRLKSGKAAAVLPAAARLHSWAASRYSPGCSASSARFFSSMRLRVSYGRQNWFSSGTTWPVPRTACAAWYLPSPAG